MLIRFKKAQSITEYAVLMVLVIGAILTMQTYMKRGIQARIRDVVDYNPGGDSPTIDTGTDPYPFRYGAIFKTLQYEPYYISSDSASNYTTVQRELTGEAGETGRANVIGVGGKQTQLLGWGNEEVTLAGEMYDVTGDGVVGIEDELLFESGEYEKRVNVPSPDISDQTGAIGKPDIKGGGWQDIEDEWWKDKSDKKSKKD